MQSPQKPKQCAHLSNLVVEQISIDSLKSRKTNPRTHTKIQIRQIADSITAFGWTNPVLIDANNRVIAGHGRLKAAEQLGIETVPVLRFEYLTDAQIRAYVIADNKLAENAGWGRELLALELQGLLDMELDFDITLTGFEMGEIDVLIDELGEDADAADEVPAIDFSQPPISRPGDLWLLGHHRLVCADATRPDSFMQLMETHRAQMAFTDPPYNVPIASHVSGLGAVKHADFAMASGEMTEEEFIEFLVSVLRSMARHSKSGAIHFICMDWRHIAELLVAGRRVYSELKNLCVWNKTNSGMGSLYRSQHELVAVFKNGTAPHINNVELGRYGRSRTNVWTYPGMNSFGEGREETLHRHPTVKPVALVEDAIKDCSKRGGIVLDAFVGAGTTLIAAERAGRRGYGIEIEPHYVDVALNRFRDLVGIEPLHAESGLSLNDIEATGRPDRAEPKKRRPRPVGRRRIHG